MPSTMLHRRPTSRWFSKLSVALIFTAVATAPLAFAQAAKPKRASAKGPESDASQLETLPGFKVEVILKADPRLNGSWISMAKDPQGRLLLGGQRGQPVTRVTLEDGKVVKQEDMKLPISETMGMLFAFDSLYINGFRPLDKNTKASDAQSKEGKGVFGMYRLRSTNHDDNYDSIEFLREWKNGSGEHGAHGIVLGPDKKLYTVCGNFTGVPEDTSPNSPHRNFQDDLVLPRAEDGNGFGAGKKPPGGYVVRMDENGKNLELFASGQRNTYDIAFNPDGELFGFDSDMEWDWGTPWYRPIRVFHAVSGGDTGFREGTGKWPEYYPDSVPASVTVGIGCPTGVVFGTGAKFPAKYQKAFYILDWTYGRLIAAHLEPNGSTYKGSWENFLAPKSLRATEGKTPLNLTDALIGSDGAMYFTVGGRGTQANLYRVTYEGTDSTAAVDPHDADGREARALRHQLEAFDGKVDPKAIDFSWPQLASPDRMIRYAARIAIESQPVDQWRSRVLAEKDPEAAITALLALARLGGTEAQADVFNTLAKFPLATLTQEQQLEKVRVYEVSISRQGKPAADLAKSAIAELDAMFPAKTVFLNREISQVLLALDAPDSVAKTMKLLTSAPTQEEQLSYLLALRTVNTGWTPQLRQEYFSWWTKDRSQIAHPNFVTQWFMDAGRPYADGSSFPRFLANFHADAKATLTPEEQSQFAAVLAAYIPPGAKPKKPAKARPFVKEWKMADLEPALDQVGKGRDFQHGKDTFEAAQCLACHRFGNEGGAVGPDLTAVASRFKRHDILESVIEPSKVISDQYKNTTLRLKNSDVVEGRVTAETDDVITIQPNPLAPEKVTVKKADVKSRSLSNISPMAEGLVNTFTKEEILDLLAYVESGGRKDFSAYKK
jgi:putative heme-binding domain-containing protein